MENIKQTRTRGNVIVENIKIGDIHYEFDMGCGIKCEVITLPKLEGTTWCWKSKNLKSGEIIDYATQDVNSPDYGMSSCYGIKLYDYEAYSVKQWI